MSLTLPAQGIQSWPSLTSFFQRGTSPNEIWYALGCQNQTAFSTQAWNLNNLSASLFEVSRTVTLDRIAFEVTTGGSAGSVGRCGIYRAASLSNFYPSTLVVDGGEKDTTSVAVHSTNVTVTLSPGSYWVCMLFGVAAPTLRRANSQGYELGSPSTLATLNSNLDVAFTYAALPATFPASASLVVGSRRILVGARFSA